MQLAAEPTSSRDAFGAQFAGLVDAWLKAHPVDTRSLSPADLHFAAAKILIHKSGQGAKFSWPGHDASRLAAILLVLFSEGLAGGDDALEGEAERKVLGLDVSELFHILQDVVRIASITRQELRAALFDVDEDGSATLLSQSVEFDAALYGSPAWRSLARWMQHARPLVLGLVCVTILALDFWSGVPRRLGRWPACLGRVTLFNTMFLVHGLSAAILFPEESSVKANRGLARYATTAGLLGTSTFAVTLFRGLAEQRRTDANALCKAIHAAFALCGTANLAAITLRCWRSDVNWRLGRVHIGADGFLVLVTALALRAAGSPSSYPPGSVPFEAACARGLCTLLLAIALGPANRRRLARIAGALGAQPLTLALRQGYVESLMQSSPGSLHAVGRAARGIVQRRLARRYLRVRQLLVLAVVAWCVLADGLVGSSDSGDGSGGMLAGMRSWMPPLLGAVLLFVLSFLAALFPSDVGADGRALFVLPLALMSAFTVLMSGLRRLAVADSPIHVNSACTRAYVAHCVVQVGAWVANALLCAFGQWTWRVQRTVLVVDGASFCFVAIALRALGPPITYPSRDGSFGTALTRGLILIVIGALLSPSTRHRLAALAKRSGWYHVTLTLTELHELKRKPRRVSFLTVERAEVRWEGTSEGAASSSNVDRVTGKGSNSTVCSGSSARSRSDNEAHRSSDITSNAAAFHPHEQCAPPGAAPPSASELSRRPARRAPSS